MRGVRMTWCDYVSYWPAACLIKRLRNALSLKRGVLETFFKKHHHREPGMSVKAGSGLVILQRLHSQLNPYLLLPRFFFQTFLKFLTHRVIKLLMTIYTTIFTILPFTTITFLGALPSRYLSTSACARMDASISSLLRLNDKAMFVFILPLIETG
jgi:hypothetical protein